jgi:integrase
MQLLVKKPRQQPPAPPSKVIEEDGIQYRSEKGRGYLRRTPRGIWRLQYSVNGKRCFVSCRTKDEAEARRFRDRTLAGIGRSLLPATDALMDAFPLGTVGDVLNDYMGYMERRARYRALDNPDFNPKNRVGVMRGLIRRLQMKLGPVIADDLTTAHIDKFREIREEKEGVIFSTVNLELRHLRAALNRGMKKTTPPKVTRIPYFELPSEESRIREAFLERDVHYYSLLDALPDSMKAIFVTAFHTGARSGELLRIKWPMVDFVNRRITIRPITTKTKRGRHLPIWGEMEQFLRWQKDVHDRECPKTPWVFFWHVNRGATPAAPGTLLGSVNRQFQRVTDQLGMTTGDGKKFVFHDLRRSGLMYCRQDAGIPEDETMLMSGHRSREVFARYNIGRVQQIQSVGTRLDQHLASTGHKAPELVRGTDGRIHIVRNNQPLDPRKTA